MARAFTPGLSVREDTKVRKRRELPVMGKALVQEGDRVTADQVVLEASLAGEMLILRLPERMGLQSFEVLESLQVAEGDEVVEGQLLCEHTGLLGLFRSSFPSPADGTIEFIAERTSHVGLRLASKPITVDAYVDGRVVSVEEGKSVEIEAQGAFIQGIFGLGGERRGKVKLLEIEPNTELTPAIIEHGNAGEILVGGSRPTGEALKAAAQIGIHGLVCGSIDDQVLADFLGYELGIALTGDETIPFTLIITEGFGDLPIAARVIEITRKYDQKQCSLNGKTQVRAGAVRPELIIPNEGETHSDGTVEELSLEVGAPVRLIRYPYFGMLGTVTELPVHETEIDTGAKTRVLEARLEDGRSVTVPRANVELVHR